MIWYGAICPQLFSFQSTITGVLCNYAVNPSTIRTSKGQTGIRVQQHVQKNN